MSIVHMGTFLCITGVRRRLTGHISDPKCRKIRRDRTKNVRQQAGESLKSLI
jgi:hypothetical protein